jgi:hypothetical protein
MTLCGPFKVNYGKVRPDLEQSLETPASQAERKETTKNRTITLYRFPVFNISTPLTTQTLTTMRDISVH